MTCKQLVAVELWSAPSWLAEVAEPHSAATNDHNKPNSVDLYHILALKLPS